MWTNLTEEINTEIRGLMGVFMSPIEHQLQVIDRRSFRDPHPDADRWVSADDAERAALRPVYERKLELLRLDRSRATERQARRRRKRTLASKKAEKRYLKTEKGRTNRAAKKRRSRMRKNIEAWAKNICRGRDLPADEWLEILTNPSTQEHLDAFTDFVFFLRHVRHCSDAKIASMLETNEAKVRSALASRKCL